MVDIKLYFLLNIPPKFAHFLNISKYPTEVYPLSKYHNEIYAFSKCRNEVYPVTYQNLKDLKGYNSVCKI